MSTPHPTPKPTPQSLRERGCTRKVRYDSEAEADLAAKTRMMTSADVPLSAYQCLYCSGYHLTSSDRVSANTVAPSQPVTQTSMFTVLASDIGREGYHLRRRRWQRSEQVRHAQRRRRNRDTASFFAKTPPPQVASPAEVDAFFARHHGAA